MKPTKERLLEFGEEPPDSMMELLLEFRDRCNYIRNLVCSVDATGGCNKKRRKSVPF